MPTPFEIENPTLRRRFTAKVAERPSGCLEWTGGVASNGYGMVGIAGNKTTTTHRAAWLLHRGPIPDGLWVLHKCDNRICVNPGHLYLGTVVDNARDLWARGKPYAEIRKYITPEVELRRIANMPRGADHHRSAAKLSGTDVIAVRNAVGSQRSIAQQFGICQQNVSMIKRGLRWAHI